MSTTKAATQPDVEGPEEARSRSRLSQWVRSVVVWRVIVLAAFLLVWEIASGTLINEIFVSKPSVIGARFWEEIFDPRFLHHVRLTYTEVAIGYSMAAVVGILLGAVLSRAHFAAAVVEPFIMGLYSVPKITLAPLFIIWLGIGMASKVAVAFISAFFLIFYNTYGGMKNLDEELVRLAKVMGAGRVDILRRIVIPGSMPMVMMGLRTALPFAVIGAVVGEFMASSAGLGFFILYAGSTLDPAGLFVGVFVLVAGVAILNAALMALEHRIIRWRPRHEAKFGPTI